MYKNEKKYLDMRFHVLRKFLIFVIAFLLLFATTWYFTSEQMRHHNAMKHKEKEMHNRVNGAVHPQINENIKLGNLHFKTMGNKYNCMKNFSFDDTSGIPPRNSTISNLSISMNENFELGGKMRNQSALLKIIGGKLIDKAEKMQLNFQK